MIEAQHEPALRRSASPQLRQPAVPDEGRLAGAGEGCGGAGTVVNESTAIKAQFCKVYDLFRAARELAAFFSGVGWGEGERENICSAKLLPSLFSPHTRGL
ncbi:hypothetical protein [Kamptonema formosum]|uniref:hypothetical protein n=1 Tax=Kamptonema formosum TaxID=331992 RepID=UPI000347456E|nr:hypothetical protein [Oscillatoria sp. PCC 10802]